MRALALVVLLGGCIGTAPSVAPAPVVPIRLDAGGIEPLGTGRRIDFGRHQPGVIDTMTRLRGAPPQTLTCTSPDLSAVAWDDLTLVFQRGGLVGWQTSDPALSADGRSMVGPACVTA